MIYIVTAMYPEAHALITRFQLKKDISHTRFQVFLNQETTLCLIISGTGSVPAAAAVSSICTECGAGQGDFLLNIGVCAQIRDESIHGSENACQPGRIFLCNKIHEQATGKTFYPDILYRHKMEEAQIITVSKPYRNPTSVTAHFTNDLISQHMVSHIKTVPDTVSDVISDTISDETLKTSFCLYDMEAAAVYQAGAYYFGPHQMSFLKVVSDDGNTEAVTPKQVEELIVGNIERIADYIAALQAIARTEQSDEQQDEIDRESTAWQELEKLCLDLHCSKVMADSVRQHIRYCILAGVDYPSVLEEMYRDGKLPCKNKREGKRCFEELKERLL